MRVFAEGAEGSFSRAFQVFAFLEKKDKKGLEPWEPSAPILRFLPSHTRWIRFLAHQFAEGSTAPFALEVGTATYPGARIDNPDQTARPSLSSVRLHPSSRR
jgi:hypothetical protein